MVTQYPDVNKYGTYDSNLCWAATAANALVWTGWNQEMARSSRTAVLDEEEIYNFLRSLSPKGRGNQPWSPLFAIDWLLRRFKVRIPTINVAQRRSPHDIFLLADFLSQRDHQCAIFEISLADNEQSHAITVYEAKNSVLVPGNDPRAAKGASYFDSDDNSTQTFNLNLEYNVSSRLYKVTLGNKDGFIFGWTAVQPYPVV